MQEEYIQMKSTHVKCIKATGKYNIGYIEAAGGFVQHNSLYWAACDKDGNDAILTIDGDVLGHEEADDPMVLHLHCNGVGHTFTTEIVNGDTIITEYALSSDIHKGSILKDTPYLRELSHCYNNKLPIDDILNRKDTSKTGVGTPPNVLAAANNVLGLHPKTDPDDGLSTEFRSYSSIDLGSGDNTYSHVIDCGGRSIKEVLGKEPKYGLDDFQLTKEGNKMLKIKNVVQINGVNRAEYGDEELLSFIRLEKSNIASLEDLSLGSKNVNNKISKHKRNIAKLVKLLDND